MTAMGVILGTAAYMSPEQARGRAVDKRTDVWAFGAVLYEMLTRTRAFPGEDLAETIAAVVKSTPDWTALPADVPPQVVTLIQRCLEKDRAHANRRHRRRPLPPVRARSRRRHHPARRRRPLCRRDGGGRRAGVRRCPG